MAFCCWGNRRGYNSVTDCIGCDACPEELLKGNLMNEYDACRIIQDLINAANGKHVDLHHSTEVFLNLWGTGGDEVRHSAFARFIWGRVCAKYDTRFHKAYRVCSTIRRWEYKSFTVSEESFEKFRKQYRKYNITVSLKDAAFYPLCDAIDNMSGSLPRNLFKEENEYIVELPKTALIEENADFARVWAERKAEIEEEPLLAGIHPEWVHDLKRIYPGWGKEFPQTEHDEQE